MKCPKCKIGDVIINQDKAVCPNCGAGFTIIKKNDNKPNISKETNPDTESNKPITKPQGEQSQSKSEEETFTRKEREELQKEIERLKLEKELATLRAEKSELEAKLLQKERENGKKSSVNKFLSNVKSFYYEHKKGIVAFLLIAVLLVAIITPSIMFLGVRGMYVNVDDPNDFISFMPLKYTRGYNELSFLNSEYVIEEGKYSKKDGEIIFKPNLTKEDKEIMKEFGMEISDSYETLSYKKESNDKIIIGDKTYVRVSMKQYSQLVNKKISVTINDQTFTMKAGEELNAGVTYGCLSWNTKEDRSGITYHNNDKQWVSTTYYQISNHKPDDNCVCTVCGTTNHEYADNYTCHDRECTRCGSVLSATTNHKFNSQCICTVCGTVAHSYKNGYCEKCGIEVRYERNGNTIYFGSYPQTITDGGIINALGEFDQSTWTSYGYYISGSVENYMYYIDKEYNGNKYRGVYFTSYRPYSTTSSSSSEDSFQYDNGYPTSNVYWFKYEPIKWDIVEESGGYATIVANLILDSQEYYISDTPNKTTRTDYQGNTGSAYSNNYQYSTIRSWLNTTFYETAFSELQKQIIQTVTVDNSLSSTGDSSNSYTCADTKDKVWLLSYKELTTYFTSDSEKEKQGTDYAKSQGLWVSALSGSNSVWWVRSPLDHSGSFSRVVNSGGYILRDNVSLTDSGVVPALKILL